MIVDCSDADDPHAVQLYPVHQPVVVWSGGGVRGGGRHLAAHRVQPAVRGRVPGRRARGETRGHRRGHARRQTVHRRLLRVGTFPICFIHKNVIQVADPWRKRTETEKRALIYCLASFLPKNWIGRGHRVPCSRQ